MSQQDFGETAEEFEKQCFSAARFMDCELISPIHDAAARGMITELKSLVIGPDNKYLPELINQKDKAKNTPLHWACGSGHDQIVDFLIFANANLNDTNVLGDTPLHRAVWRGHLSIVKRLINSGCSISIQNKENQKPLDLARNSEIATFIRQASNVPLWEQEENEENEDYESD